jgi:hypothetical protein
MEPRKEKQKEKGHGMQTSTTDAEHILIKSSCTNDANRLYKTMHVYAYISISISISIHGDKKNCSDPCLNPNPTLRRFSESGAGREEKKSMGAGAVSDDVCRD